MIFTNYHLSISRERFNAKGFEPNPLLSIEKIEANADNLAPLIERVGGPWGWTRRPEYQNLESAIKGADLFLLKAGSQSVGYCMTRPMPGLALHFNGHSVAQIENFGLFPEHNGKGWGKSFLGLMLKTLFEQADTAYLSSRSTNHGKVIKFYQDFGMHVIATEKLPDDLLPLRRTGLKASMV